MGTHILDAFYVTFGLDASGYKSGEREARKSFRDLRDESKKTFDSMENQGKATSNVFRNLRNDLAGLLLLFAGANSISSFASNMLNAEASAGRLGQTLGMSASRIAAWRAAMREIGGSPAEADAALQTAQNALYDAQLHGTPNPGYRGLGVDLLHMDAKTAPQDILLQLAQNKYKMSPQEYSQRLGMLGFSQNQIYLLMKGRGELEKTLAVQERHANLSDKDADSAQKLQKALADLQTEIEGKVRPALTSIANALANISAMGDQMEIAGDVIAGSLAVIGGAALLANIPVAALVAGLSAAIRLYQVLHHATPEQRAGIKNHGWEIDKKFVGQLLHGDLSGAWETMRSASEEGVGLLLHGAGNKYKSAGSGTGISPSSSNFIESYLLANGFTAEQALGIHAGIAAEGGGLGFSKNGAFGIGQWRGSRLKELFKRYGKKPSFVDQLAFLVWELKGGDRGMATVSQQSTAINALAAYVWKGMRPNQSPWDTSPAIGDMKRGIGYINSHPHPGVNIGPITINTQATDAKGIARDLHHELRNRMMIKQADTGLSP